VKHAILAAFVFVSIAAADEAANKKLLKDLEGDYKLTAAQRGGEAPPATFLDEIERVSIKDGKLTISFKKDGKVDVKSATLTVDASKKPAHIDLKPEDEPKKEVFGIISIDDGTVKLCWGDGPNSKRPTDFTSSKENMNFLLTLKRK
jgi:uncharacterized protein (TIGR03067 family)